MAWTSRGLRGSTLEEMINRTNEQYRDKHLALIQKVPTPITPIKIDKESRHITLAYFEKKSTVDYIGAVQGIPVCFDAKECKTDSFPLANIHEHQVTFMKDFEQQGEPVGDQLNDLQHDIDNRQDIHPAALYQIQEQINALLAKYTLLKTQSLKKGDE